jgi:hypothetical protein
MEQIASSWTPQLLVELTKGVIWPIVLLIVCLLFRGRATGAIKSFLSKNEVSEVTASASGFSAKFVAAKQTSETVEAGSTKSVSLPESMTIEAIKNRHSQYETELSNEAFRAIKGHIESLGVSQKEVIETLMKELSLLQSAIRYFDINKVLFRSQYNMLNIMANHDGYISKNDVQLHFQTIQSSVGGAFEDWDWVKYIAYPVSSGILVDEGAGYRLTVVGKSYMAFMNKSPQLIDELSKI